METHRLTRRELLVHDALAFLTLTLIAVVLFAVTLLLFRSFSAHRVEQAKAWAAKGTQALAAGSAVEAVEDFRTALTYAPDTRSYELELAEALAAAGPKHADEAYNYFLELWDTQPGDGQINLQLARLAARRGDAAAAARFYRAAIDGRWDQDGAQRRRDVRLELAQQLIAQHNDIPARVELLIVGGNWRDDVAVQAEVGRLLAQAGDVSDGLAHFRRAIALKPNAALLLEAGRLAYRSGDFSQAYALLERGTRGAKNSDADDLREKAQRLMALEPSGRLSTTERVRRIVAVRAVAHRRWDVCTRQVAPQPMWASLATRWKADEATASIPALLQNPEMQDLAIQLVYDTEIATSQMCGPPAGEDALLLTLAQARSTEGQ